MKQVQNEKWKKFHEIIDKFNDDARTVNNRHLYTTPDQRVVVNGVIYEAFHLYFKGNYYRLTFGHMAELNGFKENGYKPRTFGVAEGTVDGLTSLDVSFNN